MSARAWAIVAAAGAAMTALAALGSIEPAFAEETASACREQTPLPFLVRENYVLHKATGPADRLERKATHRRSIRYRTERYGHVEGFGDPAWNARVPADYAAKTTFMGLRVAMNRKVVPALRCVEDAIRATCSEVYAPRSLSGIRPNNTFHDGEVSNHVYGIAIDVDPDKNVCCGCVGPAADHASCRRPLTDDERALGRRFPAPTMAMPACWVTSFERFGFYWLGHDSDLEDTMHFEFLADPSRIALPAPSP